MCGRSNARMALAIRGLNNTYVPFLLTVQNPNRMNELRIFESPQFGAIRTAGTSDNPMFCLSDVCKALSLNAQDAKKRLRDSGVDKINTPISNQHGAISAVPMLYVNEANLYRVIMRSNKPEAEAFQDWVCEEVLPSIRKTGGYLAASPDDTPEMIMAKALKVADATMRRQDAELKAAKGTLAAIKEAIRESTAALEKANRLLYGEAEEAKPVAVDAKSLPHDPDAYTGSRWSAHGLRCAYDLLESLANRCKVANFDAFMFKAGYLEEICYVNGEDRMMTCRRLTEAGKKFGRNKLFVVSGRYLPLYYENRFTQLLDDLKKKGLEL